jgi:hypothetical protein
MEIHNRPGLDRMVVTSNSPQHRTQHRLQAQPDQYQAPAGTGESVIHLLFLCDFSVAHRLVH